MDGEKKITHGRGQILHLLGKQENLPAAGTGASQENKCTKGTGRGGFLAKLQSQACDIDDKAIKPIKEGPSISKVHSVPSKEIPSLEDLSLTKDEEANEIVSKGEYGDKVQFTTNYIHLKTDPNKKVYEYGVKFEPDIDYSAFRYKILYSHFKEKKDIICYDGGTKLFTPEKITESAKHFPSQHPVDGTSVTMVIDFKRPARVKDREVLYNTLFNNCSRALSLTRFKNKYYDPSAVHKIPQHKLEIWPGYVTAVHEFEGGMLLRCDINHRVLRTETALDILLSVSNRCPENFKNEAERELLGECVITRYNNSLYRIDDIDWTKSPLSTFKLSGGNEITFMEYYKRQYNLDIRDVKQPLLINRAKNEMGLKSRLICLVPELCYMTGLTDKMKRDIKVMKDIALYTRITPPQRILAFRKFLENIKNNEGATALLKRWGLEFSDDVVNLEGRDLGTEVIICGNNQIIRPVNGDWQKQFRNISVFQAVDILNWVLIFPAKDSRIASTFVNVIKKLGPGMGIDIAEPKKVSLVNDKIESYIQGLRHNVDERAQIVVCICPTAREDRYSAIKKFCCKEKPVPSQIVNSITLNREDRIRAVMLNIALQMNNKLGGASWAVKVPFKNTMIIGVDTYHDKRQASNTVGGFVASCNASYTEWFSRTSFQGPKEELIEGLIQSFIAALKYYLKKNFLLPDRIIVYRDGVSEGQFVTVKDFEVAQFLKACQLVSCDYKPKFSFVIVQKRIGTKFYYLDQAEGKFGNPTPGSVIDHTITKKCMYDFFIVSQHVRNGTATPSRYTVIYDNSDLKPDHIQRLTYKFCHLYYNWLGTIRVPAPCNYAHKLAYLVGQNIRTTPDHRLENKLYYL